MYAPVRLLMTRNLPIFLASNLKGKKNVDWALHWGLGGLFLIQDRAQRALKQKLNKHYLDLGLPLRLLASLGVAETKISCCLLGFHFCS